MCFVLRKCFSVYLWYSLLRLNSYLVLRDKPYSYLMQTPLKDLTDLTDLVCFV